jgi:hypothetical protein
VYINLQKGLELSAELLGTATPSETTIVASTIADATTTLDFAINCLVRVIINVPPIYDVTTESVVWRHARQTGCRKSVDVANLEPSKGQLSPRQRVR